jgi:hypothetical protein
MTQCLLFYFCNSQGQYPREHSASVQFVIASTAPRLLRLNRQRQVYLLYSGCIRLITIPDDLLNGRFLLLPTVLCSLDTDVNSAHCPFCRANAMLTVTAWSSRLQGAEADPASARNSDRKWPTFLPATWPQRPQRNLQPLRHGPKYCEADCRSGVQFNNRLRNQKWVIKV